MNHVEVFQGHNNYTKASPRYIGTREALNGHCDHRDIWIMGKILFTMSKNLEQSNFAENPAIIYSLTVEPWELKQFRSILTKTTMTEKQV